MLPHLYVTKNIWSPFDDAGMSDGGLKLSITKKGEHMYYHFSKEIVHPPCPLGRLKNFSRHLMVGYVGWQLKFIGRQSTHPHYWMETKNGGMLYVFGKLSLRTFQKHMTHTPSVVIETF